MRFIDKIRKRLQTFLGYNKQQETIDTLYYYINNYLIEAPSLPPAKDPDLRIMQLCNAALMNLLDKIFKKHVLTYWLDFGTLLGAHRHKGIIPWDDDMDISMPRDDYDKLIGILKDELDTNVFDISLENGRIGVGYMHTKTGIWCDIFPVDTYNTNADFDPSIKILKSKIKKFRKFYIKNKDIGYDHIQEKRRKIIQDDGNRYSIIYHGREFSHNHPNAFYSKETIYPISIIEFEGHMLSAPANTPLYLEKIFGKNYMQLPKGGILHHDLGRGALSTWAKKSNIIMEDVLKYLTELSARY